MSEIWLFIVQYDHRHYIVLVITDENKAFVVQSLIAWYLVFVVYYKLLYVKQASA